MMHKPMYLWLLALSTLLFPSIMGMDTATYKKEVEIATAEAVRNNPALWSLIRDAYNGELKERFPLLSSRLSNYLNKKEAILMTISIFEKRATRAKPGTQKHMDAAENWQKAQQQLRNHTKQFNEDVALMALVIADRATPELTKKLLEQQSEKERMYRESLLALQEIIGNPRYDQKKAQERIDYITKVTLVNHRAFTDLLKKWQAAEQPFLLEPWPPGAVLPAWLTSEEVPAID